MLRPALCVLLALALPLSAQAAGGHQHHGTAKISGKLKRNPAVKAYIKAAKEMHCGMDIEYSGDPDLDFARGMVPHHQGAVDMVEVLHKHGKDPELRELGNVITRWQNVEIGLMSRWLETRDHAAGKADINDPVVKEYREAMDRMHKAMDVPYTGDADLDFVNGMIPHHQGAIDMAWILLKHGRDPLLRDISQDVVRSQQQEIAIMKAWLEKRGAH